MNAVFWDATPRGSCKNRVLEEGVASIFRKERIHERGITAHNSRHESLLSYTALSCIPINVLLLLHASYENWTQAFDFDKPDE
jgi:hypothetical protein